MTIEELPNHGRTPSAPAAATGLDQSGSSALLDVFVRGVHNGIFMSYFDHDKGYLGWSEANFWRPF